MTVKVAKPLFVFVAILFFSSCSGPYKTVYSSKKFKSLKNQYATCAFMPVEIVFSNTFATPQQALDLREEISNELYKEMFQQIEMDNPLTINIQHKDTTLNILMKNAIDYNKIFELKPQMLASLLNVDVIVYSRVVLHSDFILNYKSTLQQTLLGSPIRSDLVDGYMVLIDGKTNDMMWKDKRQRTSIVGSISFKNPIDELKNIIRHVYNDFPYRNK